MSGEGFDPLLHSYLQTENETEAQDEAARLIDADVAPVIRAIIGRKLGPGARAGGGTGLDGEDVCQEAVLRLLARLQKCRNGEDPAPIADFKGYAAVTAYRCCYEHLRRKRPQWWRLKNRVRYALEAYEQFGLWRHGQEWLGGLAAWGAGSSRHDSEKLRQLRAGRSGAEVVAARGRAFTDLSLAEQLDAVFRWLGHPVELDELVSLLAAWLGLEGSPDEANDGNAPPVSPPDDIAARLDRRAFLEKLWGEIEQLPPRQRAALLLGLRDAASGASGLWWFVALGVAGLRAIAAALGMAAEELAALWNRLPLSDNEIGRRLGATQRQVINLRKAARERLARRMRGQ
jgi:RNA polymerase sigma factor (sigma-70 family)